MCLPEYVFHWHLDRRWSGEAEIKQQTFHAGRYYDAQYHTI